MSERRRKLQEKKHQQKGSHKIVLSEKETNFLTFQDAFIQSCTENLNDDGLHLKVRNRLKVRCSNRLHARENKSIGTKDMPESSISGIQHHESDLPVTVSVDERVCDEMITSKIGHTRNTHSNEVPKQDVDFEQDADDTDVSEDIQNVEYAKHNTGKLSTQVSISCSTTNLDSSDTYDVECWSQEASKARTLFNGENMEMTHYAESSTHLPTLANVSLSQNGSHCNTLQDREFCDVDEDPNFCEASFGVPYPNPLPDCLNTNMMTFTSKNKCTVNANIHDCKVTKMKGRMKKCLSSGQIFDKGEDLEEDKRSCQNVILDYCSCDNSTKALQKQEIDESLGYKFTEKNGMDHAICEEETSAMSINPYVYKMWSRSAMPWSVLHGTATADFQLPFASCFTDETKCILHPEYTQLLRKLEIACINYLDKPLLGKFLENPNLEEFFDQGEGLVPVYVSFAKNLEGFQRVPLDVQIELVKSSFLMFLGLYLLPRYNVNTNVFNLALYTDDFQGAIPAQTSSRYVTDTIKYNQVYNFAVSCLQSDSLIILLVMCFFLFSSNSDLLEKYDELVYWGQLYLQVLVQYISGKYPNGEINKDDVEDFIIKAKQCENRCLTILESINLSSLKPMLQEMYTK